MEFVIWMSPIALTLLSDTNHMKTAIFPSIPI